MMRVLHVIPYLSSHYGGPPKVAREMAGVLVERSISVDIVTTNADGIYELNVPIGSFVNVRGARYLYFRRQHPKSLFFSLSMAVWLFRNIRNYDLIHIHNLFTFTTLVACFVARFSRIPYVMTLHGMLDPWCYAQKRLKKSLYFFLFEKRNLRSAVGLHVTCGFESDGLARWELQSKSIFIPLYVSSSKFTKEYVRSPDPLSLIFLGRLDPIKGLPILFESIAVLRIKFSFNIRLVVVGEGTDSYLVELQSIATRLNILNLIVFAGFLDGESKTQALLNADIFVLPSYHENFSLATAEAMAVGLPVIVSDQVGIATEIQATMSGIVTPVGSSAALADAIEVFLDVEKRLVAGGNGRRLIADKYSRSKFGNSLHDWYQQLVPSV